MLTIHGAVRKSIASCAVLVALFSAAPSHAAVTKTELAGNPLTAYPYFEYVKAVNANSAVHVAIDPTRFPAIVGKTCDIYVVAKKKTAGWNADITLTDVTVGGKQTQTFSGTNIQGNTFQVAVPSELSAAAGTELGVGYDAVLDCDQNGLLDGDDYIDGRNNEAGVYIVHDTTTAGPFAVTELTYAAGAGFGIPATHLAENLFYPANISSLGQLPLIVVSHGNGHNYQWYDHLGNHLASYGYIVMSHANDTVPGPFTASTTTLGHTDAFINQVAAGTIAGGALTGHLDANRIVWIGHSRGAEGVAIAYDRIFDATYVPVNYDKSDIKLISSMLPTDFTGTAVANPHDANYHLWTASGDADVNGSAGCALCQTYHLHDRAVGHRQSTTVQGTGHAWFHNDSSGSSWFTGPCSIGPTNNLTHLIQLGHFLPLIKRYVDDNIPSIDFLTRQYETFRPIGVPTGNSCIVVTNEYYDASAGTVVIDDYQTQPATNVSSIGGVVTFDVANLVEDRLDDNNSDFTWTATDPFNGATQGATGGVYSDTSRGVVFDWTVTDKLFYEWEVPVGERNLTDNLFLSLRGAQGTQHPNTLAVAGDLTFTVTLRDSASATSSINIGAYGGGLEEPYQRSGGWHNEMETIRIRLTDFLNNGSGLNLGDIVAIRLNVGPSWGSSQGRVVIDELALSNDRAVYDGADNGEPHITTVDGVHYDFQGAGEFVTLRDGNGLEIQTRKTPIPTAATPGPDPYDGLSNCVSINTAVAARVGSHRVTFQPNLSGALDPSGLKIRVDGQITTVGPNGLNLSGGGRIANTPGGGIGVGFPDGSELLVTPGWWGTVGWYLNLSVLRTPAVEGIMGAIAPGSWLPALPNGKSLGAMPGTLHQRHVDLNQTFTDAWRVTDASSLFDYAPGTSTSTFTLRNWPPENGQCVIPKTRPVKPMERVVAEKLCTPIADKHDKANCIFDVAVTGESGFAKTYLLAERVRNASTRITVYDNRDPTRPGEPVTFTAIVELRGERVRRGARGPTGAVQFSVDGQRASEPVKLDARGRASWQTSRLRPGVHKVTARYIPGARSELLPSGSSEELHLVGTTVVIPNLPMQGGNENTPCPKLAVVHTRAEASSVPYLGIMLPNLDQQCATKGQGYKLLSITFKACSADARGPGFGPNASADLTCG